MRCARLVFLQPSEFGLHELVVGRDLLLGAGRLGYNIISINVNDQRVMSTYSS
jgi:hypothetical protein